MYDTGYYATGYYATGYYMRGAVVPVPVEENQGPYTSPFNDHYDLAYREDEEFIILLRAILNVID